MSGFKPTRSIELIQLTSEEPTRFGIGCLGSRLLSGVVTPESDEKLRDSSGETLRFVRTKAGFVGDLASVRLSQGAYAAFVELHIEQGPLLEREHTDLGIVTGIAAPASYRYTVSGFGGHAGALLMPDRRDAFCAAAEMVLSVERHTLAANAASGGVDSVATVGMVNVHPGAVNSVPSRVVFTLDIRDTDVARRDSILSAFRADIRAIEAKRHVNVREEFINADAPAKSSDHIVATLEAACRTEGATYHKMVSRAYHDTSFMALIAPVAMRTAAYAQDLRRW